jgi:hypothetical protein
LLAWLSASLTLPDADALRQRERATAPRDRDVRDEGVATIARHPARRHRAVLAWIGWGLVLVLSFGWVGVLWRAEPGVSSGESGSAALTMLVAAAATWFTWTELEWVLSPGQLRCGAGGPGGRCGSLRATDRQIHMILGRLDLRRVQTKGSGA